MNGKVSSYFCILLINLVCGQNRSFDGLSQSLPPLCMIEKGIIDCGNGTLLSGTVCVPQGYLKGEIPEKPTFVNTIIEINNIREINNKKMRLTLDFYQELKWIDNRIKTSLSAEDDLSVLNNNLINNIWKPDLWIKNLYEFKLHSVLEPTGGLLIESKEVRYEFKNIRQFGGY